MVDRYAVPEKLMRMLKDIHPNIREIPNHWGYWLTPTGEVYCIRRRGKVTDTVYASEPFHRKKRRVKHLECLNIRNDDDKEVGYSIARLLLMTFVSEPPFPDAQAGFADGNPDNYALDNLRWQTRTEVGERMFQENKEKLSGFIQERIDSDTVAYIRMRRAEGVPVRIVAREAGVGDNTVRRYTSQDASE